MSLNKAINTNPDAFDSTIDDVTVHYARATAVTAMDGVTSNTATTAITVPAWANSVVVFTRVATYGGTAVAFSITGSMDDTNYGVIYETGSITVASSWSISATSTQVHTFRGLPKTIILNATSAGWGTSVVYVDYQFTTV